MDTDKPSAITKGFGVRRPVGAFGRRLVAVELASVWETLKLLDAALLSRQAGQAIKRRQVSALQICIR